MLFVSFVQEKTATCFFIAEWRPDHPIYLRKNSLRTQKQNLALKPFFRCFIITHFFLEINGFYFMVVYSIVCKLALQ